MQNHIKYPQILILQSYFTMLIIDIYKNKIKIIILNGKKYREANI
jgi:hypothetical protein